MSVRTDQINLIVNINGNAAKNDLNNLRKKAADITAEMKLLGKQTDEYAAKTNELAAIDNEMGALRKSIGLTALSMRELNSERKRLSGLRNHADPLSQEFKEYESQLTSVIARQQELNAGIKGFQSYAGSLGYSLKSIGSIAAGYLGFQALANGIKDVIANSGKLSDSLADIQRVTGLTANETRHLNEELQNIDTRTSVQGLREIAIIAGKLGVAKEDVLGFTQAVDQLVVSLGDELGNADQITTTLGKILNVFDGKITGDNITKLGNTFVALANTGAATGAFIADFDQRLSGIAKSAGISLGALSGLGAGLEEMGSRVESSSTAIQKLIITIASDIPKAAKIAGQSTAEFDKLFKLDPTEALLKYSQGLVKNKSSFSEITASLRDAGEEGARTIETITKIGTNTDKLRGRIDLGKESIKESTEITAAFTLKNQTLGAELEKLGKRFSNFISSKLITGTVSDIISAFNKLTGIFDKGSSALDEYKKSAASFSELKNAMDPLIQRVDELTKKSSLSKNEQIELNKAIQTIGNTIPIAITEFDQYGKAIGISTVKAREFIDLQQAILKEKNRGAINEANASLAALEKELQVEQGLLNTTKERGAAQIKLIEDLNAIGEKPSENAIKNLDIFNSAIADISGKVNELQGRIKGTKGIVDELNGTALAKDVNDLQKPAKDDSVIPPLIPKAEAKKSSGESEYERLKKEAAQFALDIKKMQKDMELDSAAVDEREIKRIEEKYKELLKRALDYHAKHLTSDKDFEAQKKLLSGLQTNETSGIIAEQDYKKSLDASDKYFDEKKKLAAYDYANGITNQTQYQETLSKIEKDSEANRLLVHEQYIGYAKSADANLVTAKEQAYKNDLANFIKTEEQKAKEAQDAAKLAQELSEAQKLAGAQLKITNARPGSDQELKAKKELLNLQLDAEAKYLQEKFKLNKDAWVAGNELYDQLAKERVDGENQLDTENFQAKFSNVMEYVSMAQDALGNFSKIVANKENKQLQEDRKINDEKKKNLKHQLDGKLLSQAQYDKKIQALDDAQAKKEAAIRRKQAEREKALAIFQGLISVATAIVAALGAKPWTPANFAFAGVVAALGAVEIAAIASQPLPEAGKGALLSNGPYHKDKEKGLHVIDPRTGKTELLLEKDEMVIKGSATRSNQKYTVTGTPAQIGSKLNSMHGGVSWAPGAFVGSPKWTTAPAPQINRNMARIMEQGGVIRPMFTSKPDAAGQNIDQLTGQVSRTNEILELQLKATIDGTEKQISEARNAAGKPVIFSLKEMRNKEKQYEAAKRASGLNP